MSNLSKKQECDHEWEQSDWDPKIGTLGETIEVSAKCTECGAIGKEVWIFSCYVED